MLGRKEAKKRFGQAFFSKTNNYGTPIKKRVDRTEEQPTFWEFVQHVKQRPSSNPHWAPVYQGGKSIDFINLGQKLRTIF